tara:strand:+ start:5616 stop:5993 length:378 start_codon:yes stop_codon:yes gene_type:complete
MCHAINETPFLCDPESLKKVTKVCLYAKQSKNENTPATLQMSVCTGKMELPVNTNINITNIKLINKCVIEPLEKLGLNISFTLPGSVIALFKEGEFFNIEADAYKRSGKLPETATDNVIHINKVA